MRSAENFPFRGKFSEVYMHLQGSILITFNTILLELSASYSGLKDLLSSPKIV